MAYYHLFWHDTENKPVIVKSGFNFFAFIFTFFYFIYHRAWYSFGVFFSASIVVFVLQIILVLPSPFSLAIDFIFNLYIGLDANNCLFGEYHKKKYRYLTSDFYASYEEAIKKAFDLKV